MFRNNITTYLTIFFGALVNSKVLESKFHKIPYEVTVFYYVFTCSINVLWKIFLLKASSYKQLVKCNPDKSGLNFLAEGVGFEPTVHLKQTTVFKTASLNHSDIPPLPKCIAYYQNTVKNFPVISITLIIKAM